MSGVFVGIVDVGTRSNTFQVSYFQRNPKTDVGRGSDAFFGNLDMPGPSVPGFPGGPMVSRETAIFACWPPLSL